MLGFHPRCVKVPRAQHLFKSITDMKICPNRVHKPQKSLRHDGSTKIHVTLSCSIRTSSATNSEERARGKNPWRPTEGWELSSELKPILLPFSKPLSWACLFPLGIALFHLLTTRNIICHNIPTHWAPKCPVLASPQVLIGFSLFAPHFDGPKKIKKAWFLRGYAITAPWDDRGPTAGPGLGPLFGGALEVGRLRTGAGPTSAPNWWDLSRSTFVPSMFFLGFFLSTILFLSLSRSTLMYIMYIYIFDNYILLV